jgi:MYXO-CTERM domain-containing protein
MAETITLGPGSASAIATAVNGAQPGDVIELGAGTYTGLATITASGSPEVPIVIRAADGASVVWDGGASPGDTDRGALVLDGASWINVEGIRFVNAWLNVIELRDSSYVTIREAHFDDTGQYAVWTDGHGTHHVLIEDCEWSQEERVYTEWDWTELHHGSLGHYNGGVYGGREGAGGAVIRRSYIHHVFNGTHWWLNDGHGDQSQTNLEIYDNRFRYARDNHIEPEVFTYNMHVHHNVLDDCPAGVFSIDQVAGGQIVAYGNTGRFSVPSADRTYPWTLFKLAQYVDGYLTEPFHVLHNSFHYRRIFASTDTPEDRADDHVWHYNNAYLHLDDRDIGLTGWKGQDGRFDHDCSSSPWPAFVTDQGWEEHGVVGDPQFVDSANGDYSLSSSSPCIDAGRVVDDFTLWYEGSAPDIGAMESGRPVYLTPFEYREPPGGAVYAEKPRIVRSFARGCELAVYFSTALDPSSLSADAISLTVDESPVEVVAVAFPANPRAPVLTLSAAVPDGAELGFEFSPLPTGANGETATMWAAELRAVEIPAGATLVGDMTSMFTDAECTGGAGGGSATGGSGGTGAAAAGGTGGVGLGADPGATDDDGGCGCVTAGDPADRTSWLWLGALMSLALRRRRPPQA